MRSIEEHYERHSGALGDPDTGDDGPTTGWCAFCGEPCTIIGEDNSIGTFEFWGSKGTHKQIDAVSDCCRYEVLNYDPKEHDDEQDEEEIQSGHRH